MREVVGWNQSERRISSSPQKPRRRMLSATERCTTTNGAPFGLGMRKIPGDFLEKSSFFTWTEESVPFGADTTRSGR